MEISDQILIIFTKASVNKLQCVCLITYSQHLAVVNNIDYVTWTKVFRGCMEHSHNRSFICVLKQTSRTKLWMALWSKCKFLYCLYQIILKWQTRIVKNRESRLGNLIFWAIWYFMKLQPKPKLYALHTATLLAHTAMVPAFFWLLPHVRLFPTSVFNGK